MLTCKEGSRNYQRESSQWRQNVTVTHASANEDVATKAHAFGRSNWPERPYKAEQHQKPSVCLRWWYLFSGFLYDQTAHEAKYFSSGTIPLRVFSWLKKAHAHKPFIIALIRSHVEALSLLLWHFCTAVVKQPPLTAISASALSS